jgi:hypothetical protein
VNTQRSRMSRAVIGLGAAGAAQAFAAFWVARNGGFGQGDLAGYGYWNVLFAIYLYAIATASRARLPVDRVGARLLAWVLIGSVAGFLWTWIVAAVLGPWIGAFSFPILYIWTAAGALAGTAIGAWAAADGTPRRGRPWVVLFVPPVALVTIALLQVIQLLGSRYVWARPAPEVFTLPDGFRGQVYVVYDSTTGRHFATADGAQAYHIPASGILVARASPVQGWLDERFYYRRPDGSRSQIRATWNATIEDTPENRTDSTVGIFFQHWGHRAGGEDVCSLRYTSFFVGRKADVLDNRGVDNWERYVDSCDASMVGR